MATLDDVAKVSRVSAMTVSRVINNSNSVSSETRKRVKDAIKKLNYRPNLVARGLATSKTNSIGVLVSRLENPVYSVMVSGINDYASEFGLDIILGSGSDAKSLLDGVNTLINKQIDGLIVFPTEIFVKENSGEHYSLEQMEYFYRKLQALSPEFKRLGIPVVVIGDYDIEIASGNVRGDYKAGAKLAVEYLYKLGHRKIGMIAHHLQDEGIWGERTEGFNEAMVELGCTLDKNYMGKSMDTVDAAYAVGVEYANRANLPTAIYCANDIIAVGFMNALINSGIKVPGDISIIGHDGSLYSEIANPKITTISIQPFEIGRVSMKQIRARINDEPALAVENVSPKLVEGNSVRCIAD